MKALLIGGPEDGRTIESRAGQELIHVLPEVSGPRILFDVVQEGKTLPLSVYHLAFTLPDMAVYTHGSTWEPDRLLRTLSLHYSDTKRGRVGTVACHHNWFAVQNLEDVKAKFVCSVCGAQR